MPDRPHILLITTDELCKSAVPLYGCRAIATPGLDRLARRGTVFDAAYTASHLCLPSRCAILTGRYPHRNGSYSNFRPTAINPNTPNLYNLLRGGGYTTGHIGKCHYTPAPYHLTRPDATIDREPVRDFYMSLGLDHLDLQNGKYNSIWFWNDYSRELEAAGYLTAYRDSAWDKTNAKVFTFPGPAHWHPDAWVGRKTVEHLQRLDANKSSFVWASFSGPHYAFDPPAEYLDRVDIRNLPPMHWREGEFDDPGKIQHAAYHGVGTWGAEGRWAAPGTACKNFDDAYWQRLRHYYLASVAQIDDHIVRILDIAEQRFGDNLLVIFASDHGEMLGNHRLWAKNRCGYEDALQVPLIVSGPGFPVNRTDTRVSLLDLLPTCLSAASLECPRIDGLSLQQQLVGGGREYIITEAEGFATMQDRRYKLIHSQHEDHPRCELYDLLADPHEYANLINRADAAPIVAALQQRLLEHFMATSLA